MPLTLIEATRRVHEWVEADESWEAHDTGESTFPEEAGEENVVAIELKQTVTRKDRMHEIDPELEQKFNRLAEQWRQKTMFMSRAADITADFTYYQIVGLGPAIIPLILRQVQGGEGHWFLALRALTGDDPVKAEEAGHLAKMAQSWIEWGKRRGLIES
jgi:hypothetical protein